MISNKSCINPNGCGIGLTVSKKYIQHLGGEIDFISEYNVGTTVKFTIPLIQRKMMSSLKTFEILELEHNIDETEEPSRTSSMNLYDIKAKVMPSV